MRYTIVDALNSMYAAYYAHSKLAYDGRPVSIIYGLPNMIHSLRGKLGSDKLYMVWDGKKSSYRLALLPDYKKRDKKMTPEQLENFYDQKQIAQEILDALGIRQYHHVDNEADDMIFELCKRLAAKDGEHRITLVSNDKDFHQMINQRLKVYASRKADFISALNCKKEFGYHPSQCVNFLCLTGDDSDNISGIHGIGDSKAADLCERFTTMREMIAHIAKHKDKAYMDSIKSTIRRNKELIDLKWYNENVFKPKTLTRLNNSPKFDLPRLHKICSKYGIKSFLKKEFLDQYEQA